MNETVRTRSAAANTLWMEQSGRIDPATTLRGSRSADVCIVGGGYTGLWTALHLKERAPELAVTVLEAGLCGAGASGANGGFAMSWWPKFATMRKLFGLEEAVLLGRLSEEIVRSIGTYTASNGLDVDYAASGWLWAATNRSQMGSWNATLDELGSAGQAPYTLIGPDEAARLTGSPAHLGGVFEHGVSTVHPGKLVEALRSRAQRLGVHVLENSPVTGTERSGTSTLVSTIAGSVRASSVVLATNAALGSIPEIRRHMVVVGSDVVATAPAPRDVRDNAFARGLAVSDSRRLVHYYRATSDDRIVFGKGGGGLAFRGKVTGAATGANSRHAGVIAQMHRALPYTANIPVTHRWSGRVDYSIDGLPFAGRLKANPSVVYMTGFSGNGVAPAYLAGQVMASLALGSDDQWSHLPLVRQPTRRLPPEPFRFVGGSLVRVAMQRRERLQDAGSSVDLPTRLITALDPTSFVG